MWNTAVLISSSQGYGQGVSQDNFGSVIDPMVLKQNAYKR
ncbi:unnamed protein product, partial [Scytosiphon promiscuus]